MICFISVLLDFLKVAYTNKCLEQITDDLLIDFAILFESLIKRVSSRFRLLTNIVSHQVNETCTNNRIEGLCLCSQVHKAVFDQLAKGLEEVRVTGLRPDR